MRSKCHARKELLSLTRGALAAALLLVCAPAMAEPLTLGFLSRPGFAEMADGKPSGAFLPIAAAAVAKAGLHVDWQALPQKRLIDQVRQDTPNYCAVGIYKTPERTAFAKFSEPFYRDLSFVIATSSAKLADVQRHQTLAALTGDAGLKLGTIDGFSYGVEIDGLIKAMKGNLDAAVTTPDKLLAKINAGRIDYMLAAPEEADFSLKQSGVDPAAIKRVNMSGTPDGAARHFMCSKSVGDDTIAKLNAAIALAKAPNS